MEDDPPDRRAQVYVMDTRPCISLVLAWPRVWVNVALVSVLQRIGKEGGS